MIRCNALAPSGGRCRRAEGHDGLHHAWTDGAGVRWTDDGQMMGDDSPTRRQKIVAALAAAIESGELSSGARLPTERALADQWAVSRGVTQAALRELQDMGLTVSMQGSGHYVL